MHRTRFDRRAILKAAAGGAFLLLSGKAFPSLAAAGAVSPGPKGSLSLFNTHTGERLSVDYRDGRGEYNPEAVSALNRILRCHYTQQVAEMDLRVIDFRIPKVSLQSLRGAALRLQEGGVGYYPGSGFVHIDSGRFRTW